MAKIPHKTFETQSAKTSKNVPQSGFINRKKGKTSLANIPADMNKKNKSDVPLGTKVSAVVNNEASNRKKDLDKNQQNGKVPEKLESMAHRNGNQKVTNKNIPIKSTTATVNNMKFKTNSTASITSNGMQNNHTAANSSSKKKSKNVVSTPAQSKSPKTNLNKINLSNGDSSSKGQIPVAKSVTESAKKRNEPANVGKDRKKATATKTNAKQVNKQQKKKLNANNKRQQSTENIGNFNSKKRKIQESDSEDENYIDQYFSDIEDQSVINDDMSSLNSFHSDENDGNSDDNINCVPLEDLINVFPGTKKPRKIKNVDKSEWLVESLDNTAEETQRENRQIVPFNDTLDQDNSNDSFTSSNTSFYSSDMTELEDQVYYSSASKDETDTDFTEDSEFSEDSEFTEDSEFGEEETESDFDEDDYTSVEDEHSSWDEEEEEEEYDEDEAEDFYRSCDQDEWITDSDDEDYSQTSSEDDLYISRGEAKIYEDNNVSYASFSDSDSPQIRDIIEPNSTSYQRASEVDESKTSVGSVTMDEDENENDDTDSCPELVPINMDDMVSAEYDDDAWVDGSEESVTSEEEEEDANLEKEDKPEEMENTSENEVSNEEDDVTEDLVQQKNFFIPFIDNKRVLLLLSDVLYFNGVLKLTPVSNNVTCFSYHIPKNETKICYSPNGFYSVDITKDATLPSKTKVLYNQYFMNNFSEFSKESFALAKSKLDVIENYAVVICERVEGDKKCDMIKQYFDTSLFPSTKKMSAKMKLFQHENILQTKFFTTEKCAMPLKTVPEIKSISLTKESRILFAGGKSTGKSTTVQHMINSNIAKFGKILLIDLDIGQPIKFIPQTISASVLNKPLMGLSYFDTEQPDKVLLFGNISMQNDPGKYIGCVADLLYYCDTKDNYKGMPWIINTMGYNQGCGAELMAILLKLAQPTEVVQLQHVHSNFNFECELTPDFVKNMKFNIFEEENKELVDSNTVCQHKVTSLPAFFATSKIKATQFNAEKTRMLRILIHLSNCLDNDCKSLNDVLPFRGILEELTVVSMNENVLDMKDAVNVLNCNLVYLCSSEAPENENNSYLECFGVGIIRNVDKNNEHVYMLPSIPLEYLQFVDTLALCNIKLPDSLLLLQNSNIIGNLPFVCNTVNSPSVQPVAVNFDSSRMYKSPQSSQRKSND